MVSLRWKITALATFAFLSAAASWAQIGPGPFAVFPSQSTTDARFLGFGCPGTATFEQNVVMGLAVPADLGNFTVSLFDGDTGTPDAAGKRHWDLGTRQIVLSVYADPLRQLDTSPGNLIGSWKGNDPNPTSGPSWTASSATMPDNDWWGVTISTAPQAKAPSGNYFYTLVIGLDGACTTGESLESNLKLAASNPMSFLVPRFGIVAAMRQVANDGPIVYPGPVFPPPGGAYVTAPTTYDGTFEFFFSLPPGETDLRLYDGDFDFGTQNLTGVPSGTVLAPCVDNDDLDTLADYSGFPFSTSTVNPEGVKGPGLPPDDNSLDLFRRGEPEAEGRLGCVRYEVTDPNGTVYRNDNPSGSFEWEQFRIASQGAVNPGDSDYIVPAPSLPAGTWKVRVVGLDMSNLDFFFANACSTRIEDGSGVPACPTISTFLLGNTVWLDSNGNGVQDPGEPGIPGVTLKVTRVSDAVEIGTAETADSSPDNWASCQINNTGLDELGLYCFGVDDPGDYFIEVAPESFQPGGALQGYTATTGTQHTDTLVDGNVLTYNFGFRPNGSIGDRLWLDANGDGAQDSGEPGLDGVTVELLDSNGNVIATDTTAGGGLYSFNHLAAGTYTVRVVASTLPAGLAATFDFDGTGSPNTATVTLAAGDTRGEVDFGYRGTAALGDRVWADANANGVQDVGEAGINGAVVELYDGGGNLVGTTVTSGNGNYLFDHLPFGTYTVSVVAASLPVGVLPSYDLDGTGSANTATVSLPAGAILLDADFGYRGTTSLGDRVWNDLNANGVQDAGETGIAGVTVRLYDANGTLIAATTTAADGEYSFANLLAGTYSVRVDAATLPAGSAPTFDLDGTGTANVASVVLTAGVSRNDVDFGYFRQPTNPGTGTIGYWKNHPQSWPVNQIVVGGVTYTKSQAIRWIGEPSRGDKTIDLFKQLVAAKLNVLIDNDASCIAVTIAAADAWLVTHPVGSNVRASSSAWTIAGPLHQKLDDYNNGRLCAPHRD